VFTVRTFSGTVADVSWFGGSASGNARAANSSLVAAGAVIRGRCRPVGDGVSDD
jgi:hypothetical protein